MEASRVIITHINEPLIYKDLPDGKISLHELRVWPGWSHPRFKTILTYKKGDKDLSIPVRMGKNYTFEILSQLICDVLNTDEKVINLYYNNGRVTWCVYPDTTLSNDFLRTGKLKSLRNQTVRRHR